MVDALAVRTRSGLVETTHDGAVAAIDRSGRLVAHVGDIDRPFYLRSSAKPFQALVAAEAGADLIPLQLALACASHDGTPAQVGIVAEMLSQVGLDESALQCPPAWPGDDASRDRVVREGAQAPRRIWHNCSGKHAGWLRACVASGWPTESYQDPDHPLQERIQELVSDLGEYPVRPVGVDGCGAPVLRTTVRVMALLFARLGTESRYGDVFAAMHAYPALVSGVGNGDATIAIALDAAAKRGAAGCIGVSVHGLFGIAAKSWDGDGEVAAMAAARAVIDVMAPPDFVRASLRTVTEPVVLGGGEAVGEVESVMELVHP